MNKNFRMLPTGDWAESVAFATNTDPTVSSRWFEKFEISASSNGTRFASHMDPDPLQRHPIWRPEWDQLEDGRIYLCCVVLLFAGILCSAGGLGGGGVYVTVLLVAAGLSVRDAVPMAGAIVFSGSLSTLVANLTKIYGTKAVAPGGAGPLIDCDICRLVVPGVLFGTCAGVMLNHSASDSAVLVILIVLLVSITLMVLRTTYVQYKDECSVVNTVEAGKIRQSMSARGRGLFRDRPGPVSSARSTASGTFSDGALAMTWTQSDNSRLRGGCGIRSAYLASSLRRKSLPEPLNEGLKQKLCVAKSTPKKEVLDTRSRCSKLDLLIGVLLLCIVIICGALAEHIGDCLGRGQTRCSHPMFIFVGHSMHRMSHHSAEVIRALITVMPFVTTLVTLAFSVYRVVSLAGWRIFRALQFAFMGIFTGAIAGVTGTGGGLIFSPFFLFMGVHPAVAVASSMTCVVFSSASTAAQYILTDRIVLSTFLVYSLVNFVASYCGTKLVHFLQERFAARKSFISAVVGLGVVVSAALSFLKLATM